MEPERAEALLAAVRELSASLRVEEVAARLVDAVLRVGGARGVGLALDSGAGSDGSSLMAGKTHGEPSAVLELSARGESVGRLSVFGSAPADVRALSALAEHGALALANARVHEAALQRADRDALTGLANHGRIWEVLEREAARARRHGRALSFVMLDIDFLKAVNDRDGHLAGDAALVRIATLVLERSRATDTAGRYGGDELALVLPETTRDGAIAVAEKIRAAVAELPCAGGGVAQSVSAGVASAPADGLLAVELVRAADARLYRAKAAGGNRVVA